MKNKQQAEIATLLIGATSLIFVTYLWTTPFILTAILIALGVLMLGLSKRLDDILLFILAGVSGALAEIYGISHGAWAYANPTFFGIPIWLPILWGVAGLYMRNLHSMIKRCIEK
ncbi:MAG: hypothetical protein ABIG20_04085 [archaeon]